VTDGFHLSNSSGTDLSGTVNVPNTGGWQTWATVTATVTLPAGTQTLTLSEDNAGWNIDSMLFASGSGGGTPSKTFAPFEYVGDLGDANQIPGIVSASGAKAVILAFLDPDNGGCNLIWPGANGPLPSDTVGSTSMGTAIAQMQSAGVTVAISQGGAGGQEAAAYCGTAAETQAVYQQLITKYNVKWLDFDVEYGETSGQSVRRAQALAALQQAYPGLIVSYTLPLGPGGLNGGTGGGTQDIADAKSAGLNLTIVNGMAMDFGGTNTNQPALSEEGAAALKSQIQSAGLTSAVGLTFLPGTSDDSPPNYFTLANATTMLDWAEGNSYVTLLSFWELNRDNGGCPGSTVDEDNCSGVSQSNYEFSSIFEPF
jgi:chitinase